MNQSIIDSVLVAVIMLNFLALAISRLRAIIWTVALQGAVLGLVYPLAHYSPEHSEGIMPRTLLLAATMVAVKGFLMPRILVYAMREAHVNLKIDPYLGPTASLLCGTIGTGAAMALAARLPLHADHHSHLLVPASLSTVLTGFILLTTRRESLTQVLGYLVLENGIFIFGLLLLEAIPAIVEVGVLLDVFVGVFVMGIMIHHVNREFSEATSDHLTTLRD
jgi:hydrogenase-4 component E